LVFATNAFTDLHEHASGTQTANTNVREFSGSVYFENVLKKFSNHLELRKLGWPKSLILPDNRQYEAMASVSSDVS
jgi:hypothetical protein